MANEDDLTEEKIRKELEELEKQEKQLLTEEQQLKQKEDELGSHSVSYQMPAQHTNPSIPVQTKKEINPETTELQSGSTYLITDESPEIAIQIYKKQTEKNYTGLLVSRINPTRLQKEHENIQGDIYWLTTVKGGDQPSISGLQELSILISNFIDKNPKTVILIDGIEYLISNNDYSIVLRLIQQVRDKVSTSDAILIIPLNPQALNEKEVTLLKRETSQLN